MLKELPALEVLEWIPVPLLAFANDGTIVFANWAFAAMIGHTPEMVRSLRFHQIFATETADVSPFALVRARADQVVELINIDGSIVRAALSEALQLVHDVLGLAVFRDVTDEHWSHGWG